MSDRERSFLNVREVPHLNFYLCTYFYDVRSLYTWVSSHSLLHPQSPSSTVKTYLPVPVQKTPSQTRLVVLNFNSLPSRDPK